MILLLSSNRDYSTNYVIDWLIYFNQDFTRINTENTQEIQYSISNTNGRNLELFFDTIDQKNDISEIKSVWFRRGQFINKYFSPFLLEKDFIKKEKLWYLKNERQSLIDSLCLILNQKNAIGNYFKYNTNKIEVLRLAVKYQINIPKTLITGCKEELLSFFKSSNNQIITKPIQDGIHEVIRNVRFHMFTTKINSEYINSLPDFFLETSFQELLNKKFELRIFYLKSFFYPMAIFSQIHEQTSVDFRNYNIKHPNRTIPFKLPKEIECKLEKLMNSLGLNTGSIDMVYTTDKKFVFLEVNPVGQYDMVSEPCNYNLHKIIAKQLINEKQ